MQINAKTNIDVTLTDNQVKSIAINEIKNKLNIPDGAYLHECDMYQEVEYRTSHSWYSKEKIREASDLDKAAILVIRALYGIKDQP